MLAQPNQEQTRPRGEFTQRTALSSSARAGEIQTYRAEAPKKRGRPPKVDNTRPMTREELAIARSGNLYAGLVLMEHEKPKSRLGLVGKRFGRLVVIDDSEKGDNCKTLCYCKCDCGRLKMAIASKLIAKCVVSCGCYVRERFYEGRARYLAAVRKSIRACKRVKNRVGQRFGRLVVLKLAPRKGRGARWVCLCDCGKKTIVHARSLPNGTTTSCGCYARELARENCKRRWAEQGKDAFGLRYAKGAP